MQLFISSYSVELDIMKSEMMLSVKPFTLQCKQAIDHTHTHSPKKIYDSYFDSVIEKAKGKKRNSYLK